MGDAGVRIALWCQSHIARWRERLGHASVHAIAAPVLGGPEVLRARARRVEPLLYRVLYREPVSFYR